MPSPLCAGGRDLGRTGWKIWKGSLAVRLQRLRLVRMLWLVGSVLLDSSWMIGKKDLPRATSSRERRPGQAGYPRGVPGGAAQQAGLEHQMELGPKCEPERELGLQQ